jgi:hypothetical protein
MLAYQGDFGIAPGISLVRVVSLAQTAGAPQSTKETAARVSLTVAYTEAGAAARVPILASFRAATI